MVHLNFYPMDINEEVVDGRSEVRLWGITSSGKRILIRDRNFFPYFYLRVRPLVDAFGLASSIASRRAEFPDISGCEASERRYLGRPVKVVRVTCTNSEAVEKYAARMAKLEGVDGAMEEDLRASFRYIVDTGIIPCGLHEVDATPAEMPGIQVDEVYEGTAPKPLGAVSIPKLKVMAFSMAARSEKGSPTPEKSPIALISVTTSEGIEKQLTARTRGDRELIGDFVRLVRRLDPDVIVGYGSSRFDWPYLSERAKKLEVDLEVDRCGGQPHTSLFGHTSIAGRTSLDLQDFAEDIPQIKIKTLENLAKFLGVSRMPPPPISEMEVSRFWKSAEGRKKLLERSAWSANAILEITEAVLPFAMQLSSITGMPLDQVLAAAVGFRVDWYLVREAHHLGELIPTRGDQPYFPYRGAVVLEPKTGLHDDIAVLDFASMYPNLMILYNISPDTLVGQGEVREEDVFTIPEVGHMFRKRPPGFFKTVLSNLLRTREEIHQSLARLKEGSPERKLLGEREKAIKVIANACYGYTGWTGARWYAREVAESITALGRSTIRKVIDRADKIGLDVIYGDTDAIFVNNVQSKIEELLGWVRKELELEIRPAKVYTRVLFTEAKKRYAGLLPDGGLDIVGLEVVRGDWSEAARRLQERTIEIILKEKSPEKAAEYVRKFIEELRGGRVPLEDLVIWKTLTKPVEKYAVRAPHVEVAKKLLRGGWALAVGDKVGYVISRGPGKVYEKATPYAMASIKNVDVEYYLHNQILPAALRILEMFGVGEEDLLRMGSLSASA